MVRIINEELSDKEKKERKEWVAASSEREIEEVKNMRRQQYILNADPLFFKWQAGEGTEEEWLQARAEVVKQLPYPDNQS
jgi:hypothetical protein